MRLPKNQIDESPTVLTIIHCILKAKQEARPIETINTSGKSAQNYFNDENTNVARHANYADELERLMKLYREQRATHTQP